ncbi:hypothetical protein HDV57DRAFT_517623 [Trichoderma longibrachiatum]
MAFDDSFLSPRGLLVNNHSNFVCHGPNFSKLQEATQATETLPYSDQTFIQTIGFSDYGFQELYVDIVTPLINDFWTYGYRHVGEVCQTIVELSSTAEADYNKIFDALARLYGNESDNDALRSQVQQTIRERLERLSSLSESADETANLLKGAIENVTGMQMLVKRIKDAQLGSQDTVERLRKCHEGERDGDENFQDDLDALERLKNMEDDTQGSLQNLQQAVGATVEIVNDLTALSDYVAEHTEPGPGPLLNLEKATLLEMWSNLGVEGNVWGGS